MTIVNGSPRFHEKRQRGDGAGNTLGAGILRVSVTQTINQAGELAMKLKIGEQRHLLAKILNGSNGIEAVQGTLQRKVSIDAIQHLRPGIDDVEPLSPVQNGDIRRHFAKCFGQALAALVCNRGALLCAVLFQVLITHRLFLVKTGEAIEKAVVKSASLDVSKECLVVDEGR